MFQHVENIIKEIETRMSYEIFIPYEHEFKVQLNSFNDMEKALIRKQILKMKWNIGSAHVFTIIKDFLDITTYLLQHDEETCLDILNDLLVTEYSLLANLIIFSYSGIDSSNSNQVLNILDKSFNFVVQDLLQNPNLNQNNYLTALKDHLDSEFLQLVRNVHMNIFLDLDSCSIFEAIRMQTVWKNTESSQNPYLIDLMEETISNEITSLHNLFKIVENTEFAGWKFYIQLLGIISKKLKTKDSFFIIKDFLKEIFKKCLSKKCETFLLIMFITARQICSTNTEILGTYSQWYKATIGEMSYKITTEEFKFTMEILKKMISFEEDCEIIKIHVNLGISSPPFCNELVIMYKQLLKIQLIDMEESLFKKGKDTQHAETEYIILE